MQHEHFSGVLQGNPVSYGRNVSLTSALFRPRPVAKIITVWPTYSVPPCSFLVTESKQGEIHFCGQFYSPRRNPVRHHKLITQFLFLIHKCKTAKIPFLFTISNLLIFSILIVSATFSQQPLVRYLNCVTNLTRRRRKRRGIMLKRQIAGEQHVGNNSPPFRSSLRGDVLLKRWVDFGNMLLCSLGRELRNDNPGNPVFQL